MNSDDIVSRYGAALNLVVDQGDETSVSATIVLKELETDVIIEKTGDFVDGVADLSFDSESDVIPMGVYSYYVRENFVDALPNIYPNVDNCDGDCELPTLTICESSEGETS